MVIKATVRCLLAGELLTKRLRPARSRGTPQIWVTPFFDGDNQIMPASAIRTQPILSCV